MKALLLAIAVLAILSVACSPYDWHEEGGSDTVYDRLESSNDCAELIREVTDVNRNLKTASGDWKYVLLSYKIVAQKRYEEIGC